MNSKTRNFTVPNPLNHHCVLKSRSKNANLGQQRSLPLPPRVLSPSRVNWTAKTPKDLGKPSWKWPGAEGGWRQNPRSFFSLRSVALSRPCQVMLSPLRLSPLPLERKRWSLRWGFRPSISRRRASLSPALLLAESIFVLTKLPLTNSRQDTRVHSYRVGFTCQAKQPILDPTTISDSG